MPSSYHFTSESVSDGHPDKVADRISDAVLDAVLSRDRQGRVACETMVGPGYVIVGGEASSSAFGAGELEALIPDLVRQTLRDIGYHDESSGIDVDRADVQVRLGRQSPEIEHQVAADGQDTGAGDQGLMFGYATDETPQRIGAPLALSHELMKRHGSVRRNNTIEGLGADAKAQVTFRYEDDGPAGLHTIVLASQHADGWDLADLRRVLREHIIEPAVEEAGYSMDGARVLINQGGSFVVGGPAADTGLTGRKIVVDTYGGACPHGGGAFSGKDPTKVDRSAAYAARWLARHLVDAELARRVTIQLAYVIGGLQPLSVRVDSHGSGRFDDDDLRKAVEDVFDLSPRGIIDALDLRRPIYAQTASLGHFGRTDVTLPWERCDRLGSLRAALGTVPVDDPDETVEDHGDEIGINRDERSWSRRSTGEFQKRLDEHDGRYAVYQENRILYLVQIRSVVVDDDGILDCRLRVVESLTPEAQQAPHGGHTPDLQVRTIRDGWNNVWRMYPLEAQDDVSARDELWKTSEDRDRLLFLGVPERP